MTTHNSLAGSHRQIKCNTGDRSLLCPHRSCTVIQIDRTANFLTIRKYHYHGYASSPCVTATHFVRSSRSIPLLQCNVSTFPHIHSYQRAGTSWRIYLVAPHILTSCMQKIFSCQGTGAYAAISEWKGTMLTACYATSKANIFVISFVSNLRRRVSSMQ